MTRRRFGWASILLLSCLLSACGSTATRLSSSNAVSRSTGDRHRSSRCPGVASVGAIVGLPVTAVPPFGALCEEEWGRSTVFGPPVDVEITADGETATRAQMVSLHIQYLPLGQVGTGRLRACESVTRNWSCDFTADTALGPGAWRLFEHGSDVPGGIYMARCSIGAPTASGMPVVVAASAVRRPHGGYTGSESPATICGWVERLAALVRQTMWIPPLPASAGAVHTSTRTATTTASTSSRPAPATGALTDASGAGCTPPADTTGGPRFADPGPWFVTDTGCWTIALSWPATRFTLADPTLSLAPGGVTGFSPSIPRTADAVTLYAYVTNESSRPLLIPFYGVFGLYYHGDHPLAADGQQPCPRVAGARSEWQCGFLVSVGGVTAPTGSTAGALQLNQSLAPRHSSWLAWSWSTYAFPAGSRPSQCELLFAPDSEWGVQNVTIVPAFPDKQAPVNTHVT
jgi:hypothetical protein